MAFAEKHYGISEEEYINFEAMRQANKCTAQVISSTDDYGMIIFADKRFQWPEKLQSLPRQIKDYIEAEPGRENLSVD